METGLASADHLGDELRSKFSYYEFFAGAGMARAGLGPKWQCLFANDCDALKQATYAENWGDHLLDPRDVALVRPDELKGVADLAWASFPCQDLSQAGAKMGIGGKDRGDTTRSGAVWPFLKIVKGLAKNARHPVLLAFENVVGLLNSNGGADFRALCAALGAVGYRFGAVVVDASYFVPQSRPRVFIIAIRREFPLPAALYSNSPTEPWHSPILLRARMSLSATEARNWVWWAPGDPPPNREEELQDIIDISDRAGWNSPEETSRIIGMMAPRQLARLEVAKSCGHTIIGSLYLRMRPSEKGGNVQRAEISFGETLGCLRTPKGGASRPRIIVVHGQHVRTRLVTAREAASLMGLAEDFNLPDTYDESFKLIGDGVVPAVVRFLADRLMEPLLSHAATFASHPLSKKIAR